jgi:hypothetical protein
MILKRIKSILSITALIMALIQTKAFCENQSYDGLWTGVSDQGETVQFTVSDNYVRNFTLKAEGKPYYENVTGCIEYLSAQAVKIDGAKFSHAGPWWTPSSSIGRSASISGFLLSSSFLVLPVGQYDDRWRVPLGLDDQESLTIGGYGVVGVRTKRKQRSGLSDLDRAVVFLIRDSRSHQVFIGRQEIEFFPFGTPLRTGPAVDGCSPPLARLPWKRLEKDLVPLSQFVRLVGNPLAVR